MGEWVDWSPLLLTVGVRERGFFLTGGHLSINTKYFLCSVFLHGNQSLWCMPLVDILLINKSVSTSQRKTLICSWEMLLLMYCQNIFFNSFEFLIIFFSGYSVLDFKIWLWWSSKPLGNKCCPPPLSGSVAQGQWKASYELGGLLDNLQSRCVGTSCYALLQVSATGDAPGTLEVADTKSALTSKGQPDSSCHCGWQVLWSKLPGPCWVRQVENLLRQFN